MKYESGGITATLGTAVTVEVPLQGKPKPADPSKPDGTKPANGRIRFSAWTRSYELFYKNPAAGGVPDFDRARTFLDTVAGKLDDLVLLQTINIQVPKPNPDSPPTGKIVWDSDFIYSDDDAPVVAKKLVDECHQRGIALHAGYAVVDAGNTPGRRAIALRKFLETASDDQIVSHATQAVQFIKSAGFDGLSFDIEVNHLSVDKHAGPIKKLFTELSSQMMKDGLILSYAGYPFLTDGNAPSFPPANPLPYSLCKIGKNVMARPQAYMNHGETVDGWKDRLNKTIKCALEDVGIQPEQLQLGIDFTGDSTFDAVRGDAMNDAVLIGKPRKVGTCIWRLEPGPAPKSDDLTKWDKTLNEGVPPAKPTGQASGTPPPTTNSKTDPAAPQPDPDEMHFGVDYGSVDGNKPDFDKAKTDAKLRFAIVRSNYGTWPDPHWKRDWQILADKGIVRGAYLFLRFPYKGKPGEDPAKQAQAMINTIGDLAKTDFPPCIDVEYPGDGRKDTGLTAIQCLAGVRAAWKVLKDHYGVAPMIYTSHRVWQEDLSNLSAPDLVESPLWLTPYIISAHKPPVLDKSVFAGGKKDPKVPPPWGDNANWWIHQFQGDSTGFPGFKQVDVSRFNSMQKGASGARVKWVQRRLKVAESGTFDDAMTDAVKKHQSDNGLDATGVIDPKTFATLCWIPVDGSASTDTSTPAPSPAPAPAPAPSSDPAPQPKSSGKKKSGKDWVKEFQGTKDTKDLSDEFRPKVEAFIQAIKDAGGDVKINATYRPPERAYMMHWSWQIHKNGQDPQKVPAKQGVDIEWWHGETEASKAGAKEMVDGFAIAGLDVSPALGSRHTERKAIDMDISWSGTLTIKNQDGTQVSITSSPRNSTNFDLIKVGKTYGVIHLGAQTEPLQAAKINKDKPHFSTDGK